MGRAAVRAPEGKCAGGRPRRRCQIREGLKQRQPQISTQKDRERARIDEHILFNMLKDDVKYKGKRGNAPKEKKIVNYQEG